MKRIFFSALLISAVILVSCKKSDDDGGASPGGNSMSLTYDGTSWSASLSVQAVSTNGVLNITGSDSQARQASVVLYNVTSPGTYVVGPSGNASNQLRWTEGVSTEQTYVANFILGEGTVTLTELTATGTKGTFSFTGYNTSSGKRTITNGKFDVTF